MQKYYAVRNGRKTGIFKDWFTCEQQVKGFPNCQFKSFKSLNEAKGWLGKIYEQTQPVQAQYVQEENKKETLYIYTDGSFINNQCGYGVAIIRSNTIVRLYGPCKNFFGSRNIAGECTAVIKALEWAVLNNYTDVKIYHDYNGVGEWASDNWKTNTQLSKWYKESIQPYLSKINVEFIQIKGHNGDQWNNYVDKLARTGAQSAVCKQDIKQR